MGNEAQTGFRNGFLISGAVGLVLAFVSSLLWTPTVILWIGLGWGILLVAAAIWLVVGAANPFERLWAIFIDAGGILGGLIGFWGLYLVMKLFH